MLGLYSGLDEGNGNSWFTLREYDSLFKYDAGCGRDTNVRVIAVLQVLMNTMKKLQLQLHTFLPIAFSTGKYGSPPALLDECKNESK